MKYLAFTLLLSWSLTISAQDSISENYSLELLRTLHDTIGYYHPAVQADEARAAYHQVYAEAGKQLQAIIDRPGDSIPVQDFVLVAGLLQRHIECGHLQMSVIRTPEWREKRKARRQFATWLGNDGKLILRDTFDIGGGDALQLGTQIISIDGRPAMEVLSDLATLQGGNDEGYEWASYALTSLNLSNLYDSRYGMAEVMQFGYVDLATGATSVVDVDMNLPASEIDTAAIKSLSKAERKAARRARKETLHTNFFDLSKNEEGTAWRLTVTSFSSGNYKYVNYNRLLKETFAEINESGLQKLILDLSWNGGGSMVKARDLIRYLVDQPFGMTDEVVSTSPTADGKGFFGKMGMRIGGGLYEVDGVYHFGIAEKIVKPEKDRYTGELVVVINEGTFSAGTLVAHTLMEMGRGTAIGAKTGGGRSALFGGKIRNIMLKKEGELTFKIRIPNWMYRPLNSQPGTVTPDIIVPYTQQDRIDDVNPVTEKAREILGIAAPDTTDATRK